MHEHEIIVEETIAAGDRRRAGCAPGYRADWSNHRERENRMRCIGVLFALACLLLSSWRLPIGLAAGLAGYSASTANAPTSSARGFAVPGLLASHSASTAMAQGKTESRYAGWAMEGYPQDSAAQMLAMVRRQVAAGANVVWIGQNNPGEVGAAKREPALSYAVYAAAQRPRDPLRADALAMIDAQRRLLRACQT